MATASNANGAVGDGWLVLPQLTALAQGRPFRFVIFSWPAERLDAGTRDDAQCKAVRSDAQSYYLAWLINHMHRGVPLDLIGFSFGARAVTGALELLGGGCVAGQVLPDRTPGHTPIRAMLVAAALDSDWLLPAHRHGLALGQVERMLVSVNPLDRALHFYPRLYGRGGPEALGSCGPDCPQQLGPQAVKLELVERPMRGGKGPRLDQLCLRVQPDVPTRLVRLSAVKVSAVHSRSGRPTADEVNSNPDFSPRQEYCRQRGGNGSTGILARVMLKARARMPVLQTAGEICGLRAMRNGGHRPR